MAWDDVALAARRQARNLTWSTPGSEQLGKVERTVRRVLGRPTDRPVHHHTNSRLVMVTPTAGGRTDSGMDQTYGWAVRLTEHGDLEYLRWRAFGRPDWDAPFPFREDELHPYTAGADHWGPLDDGERIKTDLDWSPAHMVQVHEEDARSTWQITPVLPKGTRHTGDGLLRALAEMPKKEHPVLDALTGDHRHITS